MIFTDSRYANGAVFKANDSRNNANPLTVTRVFPEETINFFHYVWAERDRPDLIADTFFGNPAYWWMIMDANPEILDPFSIPLGTTIRIPIV